MRKSLAAAVIALSTATSACGHSRSEDGGPTVSRNYQVAGFDQIEVAGPYEVTVRTGSGPTVSARGPQKMLEHMTVEVRDGKLVIHPERNNSWFHSGWHSHGKVELAVTVPQLHGATIAGSGDIRVDQVKGDSFEGTVAGSGGIEVATLEVQNLKLAIAGSGAAKAGTGKATSAKFEIAGSGDIDAKGIQATTANVSIAGSGSVSANATGTADVSIMGSGDVDVTGGAKCNVSKAGSGNVRCS
ncbi:MAG TPA: head GIN domain-containing protein [Sphingomicrobium sp.]